MVAADKNHRLVSARTPLRSRGQRLRDASRPLAPMPQRRRREIRHRQRYLRGPHRSRRQVTWGTNPGMVTDVRGIVPNPSEIADPRATWNSRAPRSTTWRSSPALVSRTLRSIAFFYRLVHQFAASPISRSRPISSRAKHVAKSVHAMVVPRLAASKSGSGESRPRSHFSPRRASSGASPDAACVSR